MNKKCFDKINVILTAIKLRFYPIISQIHINFSLSYVKYSKHSGYYMYQLI